VSGIHRTCHWNYFYGDEYEACQDCRQEFLDAEEFYCLGAYTKDAKYPVLSVSGCSGCCGCCRCSFRCDCLQKLWNALFDRFPHEGRDGVIRRLMPDMSPVEFGALYAAGYAVAYRITQNDADAHDAVQTALFKMHRRPESPYHLRGLFFCAVRRAAFDIVRNRKWHVPIEEDRVPSFGEEREHDLSADMLPFLSEAINELPMSDQVILRLHYFEGLKHQEIGDRLGIPKTSVNNRLATARKRLLHELLKIANREGMEVTVG
jgi:RNA polymerase sigma factor (sigma-70 family)